MTYKINGDTWSDATKAEFARLVAERIATLREYDEHEAVVRQHAAEGRVDAWVSLAVPQAPADIDASIKRTLREDGATEFAPDYEIVGPSFELRKARLFDAVSMAEREAIAAVAPAGKLRAYQFREQDIRNADQERIAALPLAQRAMGNMDRFVEDNRPVADTHFLAEQAAREAKRQRISRWAAGLHSDIEDLTPDTIDAFVVTPFNG